MEFIHELRDSGVQVDYWTVLGSPQEMWDRLPRDRRVSILSRAGAPRRVATLPKEGAAGGADAGGTGTGDGRGRANVRVVRRRGRTLAAEHVFLVVEPEGSDAKGPGLGERLKYRAFAVPKGETNGEDGVLAASTVLQDAGWVRGQGSVLDLLDSVWGMDPYDVARDGDLVSSAPVEGRYEIERYWIEEPFSFITVYRAEDGEPTYHVEEPRLSDLEGALLATINDRMRDMLILDKDEPHKRAFHVVRKVFDLLQMYRFHTDRRVAYKLGYYFLRNYLGFGRIDPIMRDPHVEDISCNGPLLPVYVAHARLKTMRTNLVFDEVELNSFTIKLAQRGGKLLSVAQPLVDATLPEGSRIQAALGREVTSRGSAFTIRKFREDPLTAVDLVRSGTHSLDTMAFLWLAVEMRRSLLIMGATASGKTTTLNCLSQFIPPAVKIVSIEDTREITLQHENWLAAVTRESFAGGGGTETISMFDLLRAALRQRPEYLIVGEIRGQEGLTLFQAMSTGHTCFSTMHAGSVENAVYRLENAPINVPRVMLTSLDFFILQGLVDLDGKPVRRMLTMTELNGVDPQTRNLRMNELFRWDGATDDHAALTSSYVLDHARAKLGWTRARIEEELSSRRDILGGLVERNERHYKDVAKAVRTFYAARYADGDVPVPVPVAPAPLAVGAGEADDAASGEVKARRGKSKGGS